MEKTATTNGPLAPDIDQKQTEKFQKHHSTMKTEEDNEPTTENPIKIHVLYLSTWCVSPLRLLVDSHEQKLNDCWYWHPKKIL